MLRLILVTRPIAVIDRLFVPDDTYYTLTIARSLADGLGPTVDGSTLTSGFQPLLGFLMVPVFWLTDSADAALRVDLVLLVLVDTLTIGVLAWVAWRLAGRVAAVVAAAIWAVSPVAISMALGGLETSLAIFFQVGLVASWIHAASRDDRRSWIVVGAVAGFAVLARIDAL
ncbi:MAG: glycosyltransferase family 39 protein, partial [Acidimicrobiia bacterium]